MRFSSTFALITATGLLLSACSGSSTASVVTADFEEFSASAKDPDRMLKVTVHGLGSLDVEYHDPSGITLNESEKAASVHHCTLSTEAPSCALAIALRGELKDSLFADVVLDVTPKSIFKKSAKVTVHYQRDNVVYQDSVGLNCTGNLRCEHSVVGDRVVFSAKSSSAAITLAALSGAVKPIRSGVGAEAKLAFEVAKVLANAPAARLAEAGTKFGIPISVQVGTAAPVLGSFEFPFSAFVNAAAGAYKAKTPLPGYLMPPKDRVRRNLLVVDQSTMIALVKGNKSGTIDNVDVFAMVERLPTEAVDCGTYVNNKDGSKKDMAGGVEPARVTVVERSSGKVLGTTVLRPKESPCKTTTTKNGMGARVELEHAADYAKSF
jgi:hypothetical protein